MELFGQVLAKAESTALNPDQGPVRKLSEYLEHFLIFSL